MTLQVVGVGLGRTGTNSLKLALEQLLDAPCHHMLEVFGNPEQQIPLWTAAAEGHPDWPAVFEGYAATVDWPGAAFWRQLIVEYPDAVVLLSRRESADAWWTSATNTIFEAFADEDSLPPPPMTDWFRTVGRLLADAGIDPNDEAVAKAGYERHLVDVRAEVPPERLVEWTPGDGWEPLCAALGMAVPDTPFPHVNSTEEFRARFEERTGGH